MATLEEGRKGSLDRGLMVFDHLAEVREATTAELASALDISRSATYRLVERLQDAGYLAQTGNGRWRLGPAVARLASAAVQTVEVVDVAPELLRALAQQTRETVGLGVLSGHEIVFVYRELGPQSVRVSRELGARRPLHATSIGKAYLAGLPERERLALIRRLELTSHTGHTITSRAALEAEVEASAARGWSEEHGEFDPSASCCGAPVFDHAGHVVAAISVAGPAQRMEAQMAAIGPLVAATAAAISRQLGYDPHRLPARA
jgi:DNA-binding IclR family transcriptional regulator